MLGNNGLSRNGAVAGSTASLLYPGVRHIFGNNKTVNNGGLGGSVVGIPGSWSMMALPNGGGSTY